MIPNELLDPDVVLADFLDVLDFLASHGSSLILNWAGDTWEVEWITGGKRYSGVSEQIEIAIVEVLRKVKENGPKLPA